MTHWGCIVGAILGGFIVGMFAFYQGVRQGIRRTLEAQSGPRITSNVIAPYAVNDPKIPDRSIRG